MVEHAAALPAPNPVAAQPAPASPRPVAAEAGAIPAFAVALLDSLARLEPVPADAVGAEPPGEELPADGNGMPPLAAALLAGPPGVPVPLPPAADGTGPAPGSGAAPRAGPLPAPPVPPMAPGRSLAPSGADLPAPLPAEATGAPVSSAPPTLSPDAGAGSPAARQQPALPLEALRPEPGPLDRPVDPAVPGVPPPVPGPGGGPQANAPAAATAALGPAVTDPRWGESLGGRVAWMVQGDVQHARLRLDPPDLGPLEVRISVVEEEARIAFSAPHAAVREAVEAALPRLREMLWASGVNLVQVDVSGQGEGHRPPPGPPEGVAGTAPGARSAQVRTPAPVDRGSGERSLLDVYA